MQTLLRRYPKGIALLGLAVLGLIAYANALPGTFQFDDYEGVVTNTSLQNLKNIPLYFTNPSIFRFTSGIDWRPVLQITYALDYAAGGLNPAVFHMTNILFHIGTAWLIFLVVAEIEKRSPGVSIPGLSIPTQWLCFIPAALFAVHTVNAETVNYIWARSSLLAAFFYLLSFFCYLRGPLNGSNRRRLAWHLGALLAFASGMATKATAASLPAALVAYEVLFLNPAGRNPLSLYLKEPRRLVKYFPLATVLLAYVALRIFMLPGSVRRFLSPPWISRTTYLLTQFRAWVYYLKLYLWPDPLIVDYPGFGWSSSLWDVGVLLSLLLIAAIIIVAWRVRRTEPILTFFTFWFFIALLPEASIVVRPDEVTGHRPYLAHVGLSVVAAVLSLKAAIWLWRKSKRKNWPEARLWVAYIVTLGLVLMGLTAATISRNLVWRDEATLWSDVIRKDPTNARAYVSLGMVYADAEEYEKAQEFLEKAVQLSPRNFRAYFYRGYLNMVLGRNEEALSDFTAELKLAPAQLFSLSYRGEIYRRLGRYEEALADYRSALRLNPRFSDAYFGIAMVHWEKKELAEATEACKKLNEISPEERQGYACLGSLWMHQGFFSEALRAYYNGVTRFPQDSTLWYGLGTAYEELGLYKEAQDAYARSSSLLRQSSTEEKARRAHP